MIVPKSSRTLLAPCWRTGDVLPHPEVVPERPRRHRGQEAGRVRVLRGDRLPGADGDDAAVTAERPSAHHVACQARYRL